MKQIKGFFNLFLMISIAIITFTSVLTFITFRNLNINDSIYSGIISGVGSFFGGIAGGIVAFAVARSQFMNEKQKEKEQSDIKFKNILRGLLTELKHNTKILEFYKVSNKEDYLIQLETDIWKQVRFDANNMLENTIFEIIDEVYREFKDMINKTIGYEKIPPNLEFRIKALNKVVKDIENLLSNK